jgi:hypothetical protein
MFIEVVLQFRFQEKKGENVRSHFTNPNTYTIVIFANLKKCGGKMP